MSAPTPRTLDELTLGSSITLDELVDRDALGDMARSFFELFRVPLRIYGEDGGLLAEASDPQPLYRYLHEFRGTRRLVQTEVSDVMSIDPGLDGDVTHTGSAGTAYRVLAVNFDGRRIGRIILGPFLPTSVREVPRTLLDADPELDAERLRQLMTEMPRARNETVGEIARHLHRTMDLILFSGHRALLTSNMHMASVRESYRELSEKNQSLQDAFDRLKELDRLKSSFLATVSHELRTPLTSIIGYSEMLAEGIAGPITDDQREFVDTIREKGEQLLDLIKSLLDLSKLESGTMPLRRSHTDAVAVAEDVVLTLTPTARKKGVKLAVSAEAELPAVWADVERLRQIFLNLTENAIKFTPSGGQVSLLLAHDELDDTDEDTHALFSAAKPAVSIRVADTGVGIPESERERVFDAFYQVDNSSTREQGGTGLGLSIVKRLVDGHDGKIRIESNEPNGTVFIVTIPAVPEQ